MRFYSICLCLLLTLFNHFGYAATDNGAESDLEKALANPFADLTTLPIQFNYYINTAKNYESRTVMNVQPVFTAPINEHWVLVNRVIMPMVSASLNEGADSVSGFSDLIYQGYYVPNTTGPLSFAFGAMISLPTGSDARISSGKFGAGPAAGLVYTIDQITVGGVLYQNWSFAGNPDRKDVNLLTLQPLVTYRLGNQWSVSPVNNITYDQTLEGQQWTVPVGLSFTKLLLRKAVPLNLAFGIFGRVVHPDGAADVEGKAQMNLVF